MAFLNNNLAAGISPNDPFQVGVTDIDPTVPGTPEAGVFLPFPQSPEFTWLYYDCAVGCMLDSGMVIHNRLPQINNLPDTLSTVPLDSPLMAKTVVPAGVNLYCKDQYQDIIQRMGHSRYWFRLWGQALRVGYQVPIPGIVSVGGVPVVPYDKNPQWAFNRIKPGSNYGGFVIWHAVWSLWYTTLVPPTNSYFPAADPTAGMVGADIFAALPRQVQIPFTAPDDDALGNGRGGLNNGIAMKPLG